MTSLKSRHPAMTEQIEEVEQIFNPNWEQAKIHGQAARVGFVPRTGIKDRCFCCLQQINKTDIPLSQNTKQLQFLGFGFPLYYAFVRNCILLLMVTICSYNIIAIYKGGFDTKYPCGKGTNQHTQGSHSVAPHNQANPHKQSHFFDSTFTKEQNLNFHLQNKNMYLSRHFVQNQQPKKPLKQKFNALQCTSWMVLISSTQDAVAFDEKLLRGASFIIHLILLVYIRDKLNKLQQYFDQRMTSPADYSLILNHLPKTPGLRRLITQKVKNQFNIQNIADIILVPDLKEHELLEQQKFKLLQKLRQRIKHNQIDEETHRLNKQIHLIQIRIRRHIIQQKQQYIKDTMLAEKAFLIMNTQAEKVSVLAQFNKNKFKGQQWKALTLKQAPQPKQIVWQNLFVSNQTKDKLTVLSWTLSFLVLALLTVTFAFVSRWKSQSVQDLMHHYRHDNDNTNLYFAQSILQIFGLIFFVVLLNKIVVSNLFHKFTDKQRHANTFNFQFSFCLKYCLGLFFTTALMTLIVQAFIMRNYYKHDYGVVQEQTIMFIINSLFVPFIWVVNPSYLVYKFKLWRHFGKKQYTQKQANALMEMPEYDVGKRYGEVLEIMWFTFLYLSLIPIGGFFSCLGLSLYYWVDKYNLLRRSSIHSSVSGQLMNLTLNMLDFTLVLRVAGQLLFDFQIRNGIQISSLVFLCIAILYMALPINKIINYFNKQLFNIQQQTYQNVQVKFTSSYYDQHVLFSLLKEDREQLLTELSLREERMLKKLKVNEMTKNI